MEIEKFSQLFVETAIEAGCLIMSQYNKNYEVFQKNDNSLVTSVDKLAEELIFSTLSANLDGIPIVAEEEVATSGIPVMKNSYILIDPIDGTKEFMSQNGEFTVNIALIEKGVPVCGVVNAPCKERIYWTDGRQSYRAILKGKMMVGTKRITVRNEPERGPTVFTSRSHMNDETRRFVERLPVYNLKTIGSSWKFCLLAEGSGDIYPRLSRTMFWDTAAGDAVLRGAGGTVISLNGREIIYRLSERPTLDHFMNSNFLAVGDRNIIKRYLGTIKSCVEKDQSYVQVH